MPKIPGGYQDPVANLLLTGNPFGKEKGKKKAPPPTFGQKIYSRGKQQLDAYGKLLPGILDLQGKAARFYGDMNLALFRDQAPQYVQAIDAADPKQSALRAELNRSSLGDLQMGTHLNPNELRRAQQESRSNRTVSGFGQGSENDLMHEALNILTQGRGLYQQRLGNALNVGNFNQRVVGDPFFAVTGQPSRQGTPDYGTVNQDSLSLTVNDDILAQQRKAAADANRTALYAAGISAAGSIVGGAGAAI